MQLYARQTVNLVDAEQRQIGQMQIERHEEDLIFGTFVPGPAFPSVEQVFRDFEEAVEVQALHVIDKLDATIAALGLHLRWRDTSEFIEIRDVQIWSDGSITCRLSGKSATPADVNHLTAISVDCSTPPGTHPITPLSQIPANLGEATGVRYPSGRTDAGRLRLASRLEVSLDLRQDCGACMSSRDPRGEQETITGSCGHWLHLANTGQWGGGSGQSCRRGGRPPQ